MGVSKVRANTYFFLVTLELRETREKSAWLAGAVCQYFERGGREGKAPPWRGSAALRVGLCFIQLRGGDA